VTQVFTALLAQAPVGVQLRLGSPGQQLQIYCDLTEAQALEFIPVLPSTLDPLVNCTEQ
jgi:hypothetical protein